MYLDLHTHSTYSDGRDKPLDLYLKAVKKGLNGVALTDHDTFLGALNLKDDLQKKSSPNDITQWLVGAEVSSIKDEYSVHILAYNCDWSNRALSELLLRNRRLRIDYMDQYIKKLRALGCDVDPHFVESFFKERSSELNLPLDMNSPQISISRMHLAEHMLERKVTKNLHEAFSQWLGKGKRVHVPSSYCSPDEVIARIHGARGLAVLAHPHLLPFRFVKQNLLHLSWDGLEVFYGRRGFKGAYRWMTLCQQRNWLCTGGSDYHGRPSTDLAQSGLSDCHAKLFLKRINQ